MRRVLTFFSSISPNLVTIYSFLAGKRGISINPDFCMIGKAKRRAPHGRKQAQKRRRHPAAPPYARTQAEKTSAASGGAPGGTRSAMSHDVRAGAVDGGYPRRSHARAGRPTVFSAAVPAPQGRGSARASPLLRAGDGRARARGHRRVRGTRPVNREPGESVVPRVDGAHAYLCRTDQPEAEELFIARAAAAGDGRGRSPALRTAPAYAAVAAPPAGGRPGAFQHTGRRASRPAVGCLFGAAPLYSKEEVVLWTGERPAR